MYSVQVEYQDDPIEHSRDESTTYDQTITIHHPKRSRIPSISIAIPPGVPVAWYFKFDCISLIYLFIVGLQLPYQV